MFKKLGVALLLLTVGVWVIPAQAATTPWTAWLYEKNIGRMTQTSSSGEGTLQIQLPADQGSTFSQHAAVSPDAILAAYTATSAKALTVNIYNLVTGNMVYTFTLPPNVTTSLDINGSGFNYSEVNKTFAFGYVGQGAPWKIVVVDLTTFSAYALTEGDSPVASFSPGNGFFLPDVIYNRGGLIKFLMIPLGTDGMPHYDAFTWDTSHNNVKPDAAYTIPENDTLPLTQEVISALSDSRFAENADPVTGFPTNNTLQVFDPTRGARFVFAALPHLYNPRFIQADERIAAIHYQDAPDGTQILSIQVIERSGAASGPITGVPSTGINAILGTQDGFIFSAASSGDPKHNGTDVYYVETRQPNGTFNAVAVWSSAPGANAELVWVSDSTPSSTDGFTPWGEVQPPAIPPTAVPLMPVGDSAYAIGITAEVQTTGNDVLNMRSAPGLNAQRVGTIANGTLVTLTDGPQNADGFTWWRVRLPDGTEGWVVAFADGVNTLLPR